MNLTAAALRHGAAKAAFPHEDTKRQIAAAGSGPLIEAICTASLADTLRVRLLSIAQHRHAPITARAPKAA